MKGEGDHCWYMSLRLPWESGTAVKWVPGQGLQQRSDRIGYNFYTAQLNLAAKVS